MVGFYQKKHPDYSVRAKIYKRVTSDDGALMYHENEPSNEIDCKDYGFKTVYMDNNGRIIKSKEGKLETLDLQEDEIMPDDIIEYGGQKYVVKSVIFEDDDKSKRNSKRPYGKTTIEVRK